MKTKHLLTAMVLPALFAACSADELLDNGQPELGNRAKLDNVSFVFDNSGASTRFAYQDEGLKWLFENGDGFSGFLVDDNAGKNVTNVLRTNYLFEKAKDAAVFTTTSQLVEGMYWFYAPAQTKKTDKKPVTFKLPAVQNTLTYKDKDVTQAFFSPVYTISATDDTKKIPLTFKQWFATGVIKVKNATGKAIELNRIIITPAGEDNGFSIAGEISPKEIAAGKYTASYKDGKWVVDPEASMKNDFIVDGTEVKTPSIVLDLTTKEEGKEATYTTLAAGADATYYVALPQASGLSKVSIVDKDSKAVEITAELSKGEINHSASYAVFGRNEDKTEKVYSIESMGTSLAETYLLSAEDLAAFAKDAKNFSSPTNVYAYGEGAKITAEIATGLNAAKAAINFKTPMSISGTGVVLNNSNNMITFEEGLTVEEGAALSVTSENMEISENKVLSNKGQLTLKAGSLSLAGKLDNTEKGTLNVEAAATIAQATTNAGKTILKAALTVTSDDFTSTKGEVIVEDGGSIAGSGFKLKGGKLTYKSGTSTLLPTVGGDAATTIEVAEGATWEPSAAYTQIATTTLINNGTISGSSDFTVGAGTTTNNGVMAPTGTFKNEGTISNAGIIGNGTYNGNSATSKLTNNGTVVMENEAAEVTVDNTVGMVNNTAGGYVFNGESGAADKHIVYVVPEGTLKDQITINRTYKDDKKINAVLISGEWFIDDTDVTQIVKEMSSIKNVVFADNASLKINQAGTLKTDGKIIINGKVNFGGHASDRSVVDAGDIVYGGNDVVKFSLNLANVRLNLTNMANDGKIGQVVFDGTKAAVLNLKSTSSSKAVTMTQDSYEALKKTAGTVEVGDYVQLTIGNTIETGTVNATPIEEGDFGLANNMKFVSTQTDGSAKITTVVNIATGGANAKSWYNGQWNS